MSYNIEETLAEMVNEVTANNEAHGWHDESRTMGDEVALLHSEVSEMFEEWRDGRVTTLFEYKHPDGTKYIHTMSPLDGVLGKPIGVPSEAADILIRLLDFCGRYNIDLGDEYIRKMTYNRTRPFKHGGKKL